MEDTRMRPAILPTLRQRIALRMLNTLGWQFDFKPLPGPHGIAVVYPHTSNWDFPIGLLAKWAVDLPFSWLAKDSLFRGPMGALMRYWGGMPIDRSSPQGAIGRLAETIRAAPWLWLVITPEGTRGYRPHWKSGFYRIARTAAVPVLLVAIDYGRKVIDVTRTIRLTGDEAADMAVIADHYADVRALHPASAAPVRLADPDAPRDPGDARRRA
jgi:1-acyl-sn-glycerol-3-phosphate acyltransferase